MIIYVYFTNNNALNGRMYAKSNATLTSTTKDLIGLLMEGWVQLCADKKTFAFKKPQNNHGSLS